MDVDVDVDVDGRRRGGELCKGFVSLAIVGMGYGEAAPVFLFLFPSQALSMYLLFVFDMHLNHAASLDLQTSRL